MLQELKGRTSANFTFDSWTYTANRNYIAIIGHYITKEFRLVDRCLVLEHYEVGHSAIVIKQKLKQLLAKYELSHCSKTVVNA